MYYTKLFEKNRRQILENYLNVIFPNAMANLISEYDCYLEGKSFIVDCFPDVPQISSLDHIGGNRIIRCISTLHDGRIAIGGDNICKIINPQTGLSDAVFTNFSGSVSCITELRDGRIIICSGHIITHLQIWDPFGSAEQPVGPLRQPRTGNCDMILQNDDTYITKIIVLSDGRVMG